VRDKAPETYEEKLAQLEELRHEAVHAGSDKAVERQHEKGKYTARERVEKLLDPGSFQELDTFVRHRTTTRVGLASRKGSSAWGPTATCSCAT
jgi:propionyl-CoA carboxylase beta chain